VKYTPEILEQLHKALFEITEEIQRVCKVLGVKSVALGGTAIGVHFWQNILPWDDDVDLGMLRADYERFVAEAPALLGDDFFLQEFRTEGQTPFYWAKVRKRSTLFLESGFEWFDICHGIYVDLLPMDRVPNNPILRKIHRAEVCWWAGAWTCQPFWERRGEIPRSSSLYYQKSLVSRAVLAIIYRCKGSRKWLWRRLNGALVRYNGCPKCAMVDVIRTGVDLASYDSIANAEERTFGRLMLHSPKDLEAYLHHHYPVLIKDIPDEQKVNHAPLKLSFDTQNGKIYE
jgi:lipopolysaccharide cholinephosphotransferase